jgi:hypothetical protein
VNPPGAGRGFDAGGRGYPAHVTSTASQQELVRFLEDRFTCAQACTECARACALRASLVDPDGAEDHELLRRKGILCAEVCDATCRMLSDQGPFHKDAEDTLRMQLEWTRTVCLESAQVFERHPEAEETARACRACARACTDFMTLLD